MMYTRLALSEQSHFFCHCSLIIALRYALTRKTFITDSGSGRYLIDYETHLLKFGSMMATGFAFNFATYQMSSIYKQMLKDIDEKKDFSML